MNRVIAVFQKELRMIFSSPIFYAVAFIFLLVSGYFFYSNTAYFSILSFQATRNPFLSERLNLTDMVLSPFLGDLSVVLLLMVPLITMRVYSEEKKTGTIELLFTYPVSDIEVLAGKYLATIFVMVCLISGTIPHLVILEIFGNLEWGVVISGYLGLLLLGASFISLEIFASSLTENQIISAVITFGSLLLFFTIGWAKALAGPVLGGILSKVSIVEHFDPFTLGLIDTRDIVFYIMFTALWLFMTLRSLGSKHWRG